MAALISLVGTMAMETVPPIIQAAAIKGAQSAVVGIIITGVKLMVQTGVMHVLWPVAPVSVANLS